MFKKYIELFEKSVLKTLLWFFFSALVKAEKWVESNLPMGQSLKKNKKNKKTKQKKNPLILGDHMSGQFQKFQDSPVASTSNSSSMVTKW